MHCNEPTLYWEKIWKSHFPSVPKWVWVGKAIHYSTGREVLSHPPIQAYVKLWERGQKEGGSTVIAASLLSALLLCSWSCSEQEGWAIAGGMQRAEQSSSPKCCHTETCPPPAFVSSPLPHFHEQDNAKSCCAYEHWGWGLKSWGIAQGSVSQKREFSIAPVFWKLPGLPWGNCLWKHAQYIHICLSPCSERMCREGCKICGKGEEKHQYDFIIISLKGTNLN